MEEKAGVLGWIVSIVTAVVGGFVAAEVGNMVMEPMFMLLSSAGFFGPMGGSLAATGGPLLYISHAVMMLLMLLGSWFALRLVSRWR